MLTYKTGNLLAEPAEALVNPVNCVGVMGRGLALQFKNAFRANYNHYARACLAGQVRPGTMYTTETLLPNYPHYIINFPTKRHWRDASRLEDIDSGLTDLRRLAEALPLSSIALPALGCGLGGLRWADVQPLIETHLSPLQNTQVIVFEPS